MSDDRGTRFGSAAGRGGISEPGRTPGAVRPAGTLATGHSRTSSRKANSIKAAILVAVLAVVTIIARNSRHHDTGKHLGDLVAGNCIAPPGDSASTVKLVDCATAHTVEVYAVGDAAQAVLTGSDPNNDPEIIRICRTEVPGPVVDRIVAALQDEDAQFSFLVGASRTGTVACLVTTPTRTGSYVTGSAVATTSVSSGAETGT